MNVGIRDLLGSERGYYKRLQQRLLNEEVPGNWSCRQNMSNLISGKNLPKDPYVYIFLADFFNVDVETIIYRYSDSKKKIKTKEKVNDYDFF